MTKYISPRYYTIFTIIAFCYPKQQAMATEAVLSAFLENPNAFLENPNSDTVPMVPAPIELTGLWTGSNCGTNDTEPVLAQLQMAENGVNVWSFENKETGELLVQTGEGVETMVGYQCIDVGRGYWWGMVPYSDVLWCNLFQVEEVSSDENTILVSYHNLAYGGEGVGALSAGACPTHLASGDLSVNHVQASFTKRILKSDALAMTCNVPAGTPGRRQPSHNSQFLHGTPIPNPFIITPSEIMSMPKLRAAAIATDGYALREIKELSLPILSETTCEMGNVEEAVENELEVDLLSASATSNIGGLALVATMTSLLSWAMM